MKICNNCGAQLSCGCQRRDASDGKSCCDQCINTYETALKPPPVPLPVPEPSSKTISVKKASIDKEITNNE
jgi:hypothetical protein